MITLSAEEHTIGQTMNLKKGEQITVKNLIYGALIDSANDAALALGLNYPSGGYSGFVTEMNRKAQQLGLTHTVYKDVSGVEALGHLTTARDLAHLTQYAIQKPLFKEIVATKTYRDTDVSGKIVHQMTNTNELLGELDGVIGVKTGWTEHAKECLVTLTERDGHQIIVVVLGSNDRFGESTKLINWVFANYHWQTPPAGQPLD
jgi:D-alanyl-D-alanine carboxypeptidase